nr:ribbon-helix-helix domain-containing protein [uncultured Gellertiella sp.]
MIRKYSATLHGHRTSFSLEPPFFDALHAIATERGMSLASLIASIDDNRTGGNLSSALRLHVLDDVRRKLAEASCLP